MDQAIETLRQQAEQLERRAAKLRNIIKQLEEDGDIETPTGTPAKKGKAPMTGALETALRMLETQDEVTIAQVHAKVGGSRKLVGKALGRASRRDKLKRVSEGTYALADAKPKTGKATKKKTKRGKS